MSQLTVIVKGEKKRHSILAEMEIGQVFAVNGGGFYMRIASAFEDESIDSKRRLIVSLETHRVFKEDAMAPVTPVRSATLTVEK